MRGATCSIKLKSARNQRWQKFSNRLSSWDMGPQYLDSARQNASIYLPSLSSNSTICWSTHGKTCELVSRTRERSRLRPKNPETPKNSASVLKNMVTYPPPTHTFLKWPFPTDFKKYTHTPPPPQVTTCLHIGAKVVEIAEKCQNPQSWQVLNVPERYTYMWMNNLMRPGDKGAHSILTGALGLGITTILAVSLGYALARRKLLQGVGARAWRPPPPCPPCRKGGFGVGGGPILAMPGGGGGTPTYMAQK